MHTQPLHLLTFNCFPEAPLTQETVYMHSPLLANFHWIHVSSVTDVVWPNFNSPHTCFSLGLYREAAQDGKKVSAHRYVCLGVWVLWLLHHLDQEMWNREVLLVTHQWKKWPSVTWVPLIRLIATRSLKRFAHVFIWPDFEPQASWLVWSGRAYAA